MSSVPGRYPDDSLESDIPATMSSAAINMSPGGYGGFETMSRSYNDGAPDRYTQARFDNHAASQASRAHLLPPPQGLVAGVPCGSDSFRPQPHTEDHQYFKPTHVYQDSSGFSAPSHVVSPLPLPSPSLSHVAYAGTMCHTLYPSQSVPDLAPAPPPPPPPPPPLAPVTVSGSECSSGPRPSRESIQARPLSSKLYRRHVEASVHLDAPRADRQTAARPVAAAIKHDPPSRPPRPDNRPFDTRIPNLLGAGRTQALADIRFRLKMRQQPNAARACGFGDRDRRVIDPPPIVELVVESSKLTPDEIRTYLRYESYVMNCQIYDETGTRDSSNMPEEYQHQRRLMGSLVSTPFVGQDENGKEGCFFCFSDLSCRTPGTFRLKFILMMIDPMRAAVLKHFPILAEINSGPFKVYSAKEFPGMVASSSLAKRLKEQGCIISIKKGNDRSKNARGQDELSDNDDDDDGEGSQQRKRRAIR